MTPPIRLRSTRRRRRGRPWIIGALVVAAGWSGAWWLGREAAFRSMDAWLSSEASNGRPWSCPDREIAGFPVRFTLTCSNPTFTARIGGQRVDGKIAGLRAEVSLARPNAIALTLASPMTLLGAEEGDAATVSWSALSLTVALALDGQPRADASVEGLDVDRANAGKLHVDRGELQLQAAGKPDPSGRSYDTSWRIAGFGVPSPDASSPGPAPLTLEGRATISALDVPGLEPWPQLAERWRAAGGRIELASLTYGQGPLQVAAHGQLALDDQHRPSGLLQATVSGYDDTLVTRLGIPPWAVALVSRVPVPIALGNGRVAVGPFKTSMRLAPLY